MSDSMASSTILSRRHLQPPGTAHVPQPRLSDLMKPQLLRRSLAAPLYFLSMDLEARGASGRWMPVSLVSPGFIYVSLVSALPSPEG